MMQYRMVILSLDKLTKKQEEAVHTLVEMQKISPQDVKYCILAREGSDGRYCYPRDLRGVSIDWAILLGPESLLIANEYKIKARRFLFLDIIKMSTLSGILWLALGQELEKNKIQHIAFANDSGGRESLDLALLREAEEPELSPLIALNHKPRILMDARGEDSMPCVRWACGHLDLGSFDFWYAGKPDYPRWIKPDLYIGSLDDSLLSRYIVGSSYVLFARTIHPGLNFIRYCIEQDAAPVSIEGGDIEAGGHELIQRLSLSELPRLTHRTSVDVHLGEARKSMQKHMQKAKAELTSLVGNCFSSQDPREIQIDDVVIVEIKKNLSEEIMERLENGTSFTSKSVLPKPVTRLSFRGWAYSSAKEGLALKPVHEGAILVKTEREVRLDVNKQFGLPAELRCGFVVDAIALESTGLNSPIKFLIEDGAGNNVSVNAVGSYKQEQVKNRLVGLKRAQGPITAHIDMWTKLSAGIYEISVAEGARYIDLGLEQDNFLQISRLFIKMPKTIVAYECSALIQRGISNCIDLKPIIGSGSVESIMLFTESFHDVKLIFDQR